MDDFKMKLYHIPGCPYSERVEILLELKGLAHLVEDIEIDITKPRPEWLLEKTRGSTALPVMDAPEGALKESMVILRYLEDRFPERAVKQRQPYYHAIESLLAMTDGAFSAACYRMIRNKAPEQRATLLAGVDEQFKRIDSFLMDYNAHGVFLFEEFGWAETVFTPLLKRFWFLEYYENYVIPPQLARVRRWRDACVSHRATQSRTYEEIIKLYYDYTQDSGGGKVPPGRTVSSFALTPHWSKRPMPPRDKWAGTATDAALGLVS